MKAQFVKLHIEAPEHNLFGKHTRTDYIPVVKYIVIYKSYQQPERLGFRIRNSLSRHYCIGILTERNEYYKSYFGYNRLDITKKFLQVLKTIFITRYAYSPNTKILIYDDISKAKEPLMTFVQILSSCHGIKIRKVSEEQMFRTVCKYYHLYGKRHKRKIDRKNDKRRKIKPTAYNELSEKMITNGMFEFIIDPNWEHNLRLKPETEQRAEIRCAQGILYLFVCSQNAKWIRTYKEKIKNQLNEQTETV